MPWRLPTPNGAGGCGCACGGPTIGTITCVSRTGSGNLRGYSKFLNQNAGDWNLRKFTRVDYSQSPSQMVDSLAYNSTVNGTCQTLLGNRVGYQLVSNFVIWNVATNARVGTVTFHRYVCGSFFDSWNFAAYPFSNLNLPASCSSVYFCTQSALSEVLHQTAWSNRQTGCNCCDTSPSGCGGNGDIFQVSGVWGTAWSAMSIPDSVAAALARGTPTIGSDCKTTKGTIGSTGVGSTTQLAVTGVRSVTATLVCSGLADSADYTITIKLDRYTAGGGSFVDSIFDTIDFTAGDTSEEIEYEVPINTDFDYAIDTSYKDIAAA